MGRLYRARARQPLEYPRKDRSIAYPECDTVPDLYRLLRVLCNSDSLADPGTCRGQYWYAYAAALVDGNNTHLPGAFTSGALFTGPGGYVSDDPANDPYLKAAHLPR